MFEKISYRQALCIQRSQLQPEIIQQASHQATMQLLNFSQFIDSQSIGLYVACRGELDPMVIADHATRLGKNLFLPVIVQSSEQSLLFYSYRLGDELKKNRFDIPEPDILRQAPISIAQLDLIFMPLVGFDETCNRLGMGTGYYDRSLSPLLRIPEQYRPVLIGLAYEFQKIDQIIPDAWDVSMDYVVTEKRIYARESGIAEK